MTPAQQAIQPPTEEAYAKIDGWCSPTKRGYLQGVIHAMRPALVVEIGTFGGSSAIPMAVALAQNPPLAHGLLPHIVCIDPWEPSPAVEGMKHEGSIKWWTELNYSAVMEGFLAAVKQFGVRDYVKVIRKTSDDAIAAFEPGTIDLLHIDGCHSFEPCRRDCVNYLPRVKVGGIIVMDDAGWVEGGVETVRPNIQWMIENGCDHVTEVTGATVLRRVR
jgi:predicted O-methyltransferase YrrM